MAQIPAEVVEATWQRVGAAEPADLAEFQHKCGRSQPDLTAFVLAYSSDLRPDALGLVLYAMVVVYEMFRVHHTKVRKARERVVARQWDTSIELTEAIRESGVTRRNILEVDIATAEPFALKYVLEAFTEQSDDDSIEISDDEFWQMVAVLKTVVETLHEMAGAERVSV